MEEEQSKMKTKYKILESFDDLSIISNIISLKGSIKIFNEFEVEPYEYFSVEFQAEYWYLKYQLLRNSYFVISKDEFSSLFIEKNLNIIWMSVTDDKDFILECRDGGWFLSIEKNNVLFPVFKEFKLSPVQL
jgi:hypothetical protein